MDWIDQSKENEVIAEIKALETIAKWVAQMPKPQATRILAYCYRMVTDDEGASAAEESILKKMMIEKLKGKGECYDHAG